MKISEDEFIARFRPEENERGELYRQRHLHDPNDTLAIQQARAEGRLWTAVEGDSGAWCCSSGFHYVNLLYYIITAVPVDPGEDFLVEDEDDSFDSEEPDDQ